MQIIADVGGRPGKDCGGFCKYCYFRNVGKFKPFGCKNCPPGKIGCKVCTKEIAELNNGFLPPAFVISNIQSSLLMYGHKKDVKINISGGGDVSCYPYLLDLTREINNLGLPIHLGYTSGKGIDDARIAYELIDNGVDEVTFTVFSVNPKLRKEWMSDRKPEESLKALKIFCENIEVHCAAVIIPGVNDGEELYKTCAKLEEWGAEGFILMRFANYKNQGLILGNGPIIKGVEPHTLEEFSELVKKLDKEFDLRITGTPLCDPKNGAPFALSREENKEFLKILPKIKGEATILTSKIAAPYIYKIIKNLGAEDKVNVYPTKKDIGCLITREDLKDVDLSKIKDTVIIPGRALVHDMEAEKILSKDGNKRIVVRGPDRLSVDGEMSGTMSEYDVIETEMEAWYELINIINFYGLNHEYHSYKP